MQRISCVIIFWISSLAAYAQLFGQVVDAQTQVPMAFVTVVIEGEQAGAYTDIDGRFELPGNEATIVRFSFVGYTSKRVKVLPGKQLEIALEKERVALAEALVFPGVNPAEALMQKVIDRKDQNDPASHSFIYNAYNKLIFTAQIDSVYLSNPSRIAELDSNDQRAIAFFEEQHLLLMESITERRFMPIDRSTEKVLASRVSGLQTPDFALLSSQLQSFSFYEEETSILDIRYLSPLHKAAISKYLFIIEDTTWQAADTVFILSFRPKKGKNFHGMKGLLHINSDGYALQHVLAEPANESSDLGIHIRQRYERVDGEHWFPLQLNTDMVFNNLDAGSFKIMGIGRSYHSDIVLDPPLRGRDIAEVTFDMQDAAIRQPETFWNQYRPDRLDDRELRTYEAVDSISKAEGFDRRYRSLQALISGKLRLGKVDLDLGRLFAFNNYEGFRLGAGMQTNDGFIRSVRVGGYAAYGFQDHEAKGGGNIEIDLRKRSNTRLNIAYYSDVFERGGQRFPNEQGWLSSTSYYHLFVKQMDRLEVAEVELSSRLPAYLSFKLKARQGSLLNNLDHRLVSFPNDGIRLFHQRAALREAELQLQWSFREKTIQTVNRRLTLSRKWPLVGMKATAGEVQAGGDVLQYLRLEASLDHTFKMPMLGDLSLFIHAGKVYGDPPALRLFSLRGTKEDFSVATPFAFETIDPSSTYMSEYAAVHVRHQFRDLLFSREKWKPYVVLVHSMALGKAGDDLRHLDAFQRTSYLRPYMESGLELQHLIVSGFSSFGIGSFYSYGRGSSPYFKDNLVLKLSVGFVFG